MAVVGLAIALPLLLLPNRLADREHYAHYRLSLFKLYCKARTGIMRRIIRRQIRWINEWRRWSLLVPKLIEQLIAGVLIAQMVCVLLKNFCIIESWLKQRH
ncbi:MAG: hypothetical protein KatS3mg110_3333 [Pirellulaceae bacterium]|nr:MAG: hypothetical protein KatS3mg110_3333 [Pirellulaceae bacterium]